MLTKVLIYMILFFLVASPATFKFMRKMLGGWVASAEGIPHAPGLLLHSVVYVLLACYLPAKLVSNFAGEYYEEEKYIGEYGATKLPFGISDSHRQEAGNPGSIY
jgi:hypothetical protein